MASASVSGLWLLPARCLVAAELPSTPFDCFVDRKRTVLHLQIPPVSHGHQISFIQADGASLCPLKTRVRPRQQPFSFDYAQRQIPLPLCNAHPARPALNTMAGRSVACRHPSANSPGYSVANQSACTPLQRPLTAGNQPGFHSHPGTSHSAVRFPAARLKIKFRLFRRGRWLNRGGQTTTSGGIPKIKTVSPS